MLVELKIAGAIHVAVPRVVPAVNVHGLAVNEAVQV